MTKEEFKKLKRGDVVRNLASKRVWVVTGNYGEFMVATDCITMHNPYEWENVYEWEDVWEDVKEE